MIVVWIRRMEGDRYFVLAKNRILRLQGIQKVNKWIGFKFSCVYLRLRKRQGLRRILVIIEAGQGGMSQP